MGTPSKQTVEIGHASARDIERNFDRWATAVDVSNTPLGRSGQSLVKACRKKRLGIAMRPDFADVLVDVSSTYSPEATITTRSIVLSARVCDHVIGGLVARPQLSVIGRVAVFGAAVQMQTLVRLMKLEIVAVEPEYQRKAVGATLVQFALDELQRGQVHLVYGSFPADRSHLEHFYRGLGFTVPRNGYGIDVTKATGASLGIGPENNERLFAQSLGSGPKVVTLPAGH
ncbi:GNAT family N-acetyltransferase [Nocardia sp. NPDC101769]|uniref:GNAT family N-acetyltransferase n=1 Tax=Nocardia sp. NPDC101769 TaxID=3364333 RepID=UPI00382795B1